MLKQDTDSSDLELVEAVARGCPQAFLRLSQRYRQRIVRFVGTIIRYNDVSEEIANDTLVAIWRGARSFRGGSEASTWIFGIARNLCMKSLRSARRAALHQEDLSERSYDPWLAGEQREWLGVAIAQLNADQRLAIQLAYGLGHSCQEIADRVRCPVNTVKTRIHYGRRRLRELLTSRECQR